MCNKKMDAKEALGKETRGQKHDVHQASKAQYLSNRNLSRLPEIIPEIVCVEASTSCIEIQLPTKAYFYHHAIGRYKEKHICTEWMY